MILMLVTGELCIPNCIPILEGKACLRQRLQIWVWSSTGCFRLRFEDCENVQFTVHWYPVHKLIIRAVSWVPTDECSSISWTFLVGFPHYLLSFQVTRRVKRRWITASRSRPHCSATSDGDTLNLCHGFKWVVRAWLKYSHMFDDFAVYDCTVCLALWYDILREL